MDLASGEQRHKNVSVRAERAKIAVPIKLGDSMPIERLADRTRASDSEKPAILALAKAMELPLLLTA